MFELKRAFVSPFADGTFRVVLPDIEEDDSSLYNNVRGRKCFIISVPHITDARYVFANGLTADAIHRADSESEIVLWEMYNGHYRQDRRQGRESLGTPIVAAVYNANHIGHIFTYDAHYPQVEGYFPKFENLPLHGWLAVYFLDRYGTEDLVTVSPDVGSVRRTRDVARFLKVPMAYMDKERDPSTGEARIERLVGEVRGRRCLLVDDLLSSGRTYEISIDYLKKEGAKEIIGMMSHLQLTGGGKEKVKSIGCRVIGGDTFDHIFTPNDLKIFDVADTAKMTAMIMLLKILRKDIGRYFNWSYEENKKMMELQPLYQD